MTTCKIFGHKKLKVEKSVDKMTWVESKCGSIIRTNDDGKLELNNLPVQTYLSILNSTFPKNLTANMVMKEEE